MEKYLCPSLMCANFDCLKEEIIMLDKAGIDIFHIDVMDGNFVPNFGMGLQDIEAIRRNTIKQIDVHLMTINPSKYIKKFVDLGVNIIYIHPEADLLPARTIGIIKENGKKAGIAINPGTAVETITPLLAIVDYVMVMTVHPGFSGQPYLSYVEPKIDQLLNLKISYNYEVMVDGAISPAVIKKLGDKGVKGFILGTSSLFNKKKSYKEIILSLRNL